MIYNLAFHLQCVQWHENCNYIATGSSDKTVRLWDVQSGECVRIFIGHRSMVLSLAMSPDGRYMASGDEDGTIMMWDLSSGRCVTPLVGHSSCVWTLDFRLQSLFSEWLEDIFNLSNLFWLPFGLPQLWRFTSCVWVCWLHCKTVGRDSKHKSTENRREVSFCQNEKLTLFAVLFSLLLLEVCGDLIFYVLYQQNCKYKQTQIIEDSPYQVYSSLLIAGKILDILNLWDLFGRCFQNQFSRT